MIFEKAVLMLVIKRRCEVFGKSVAFRDLLTKGKQIRFDFSVLKFECFCDIFKI